MTVIKTTINIDEKVWEEFKRAVNSKYGGSRNLSKVVEEAIRNYNIISMLRGSAEELGIEITELPSSSEVEARRPTVDEGSAKVIRDMRDEREARVLGQ